MEVLLMTREQLQARKDELWSFMQQVKNLPAVLDQMQIAGTREQFAEFNVLVSRIREMN